MNVTITREGRFVRSMLIGGVLGHLIGKLPTVLQLVALALVVVFVVIHFVRLVWLAHEVKRVRSEIHVIDQTMIAAAERAEAEGGPQ